MQTSTRFGVYLLTGVIALGAVTYFSAPKNPSPKYWETSMLHIFENIAEEHRTELPDLYIDHVEVEKIASPKDYFNFYKYQAKVVISNQGGDLRDGQILLTAKDQSPKMLGPDLDLKKGEELVIEDYPLLLAGDFNVGEVNFVLSLESEKEENIENNSYELDIFESKSGVKTSLKSFLKGDIKEGTNIWFKEDLLVRSKDYRELVIDGEIVSYYQIPANKQVLADEGWRRLFEYDGRAGYVYLEEVDEETGFSAVSNIWHFSGEQAMNRAEFAKIFVEESGMEMETEGLELYEDVDYEAWYAPYVQTLHNQGLLEGNKFYFFPEDQISRAEVVKMVMDYFDADLVVRKDGSSYFGDIEEEDGLYAYLYSLYASGRAEAFADEFRPDQAANKEFLKHLINEYK